MWWALIEEIAPRAEEMACEKEMACCVRGVVPRIQGYMGSSNWGSACVYQGANQRGKIFVVKLYSRKIFSYIFFVRKYFYNEIKANYGIRSQIPLYNVPAQSLAKRLAVRDSDYHKLSSLEHT